MDIKTAPLKNTTAPAQIADITTRTPAKITDEGKSFVDEMVSVPNMEVNKLEPETKQDTKISNESADLNNNIKDFEFIATTNDFNAAVINENLKKNNSEILHKNAQKELADEIVLMNKQDIPSEKKVEKSLVSEKNTKQNNKLPDLIISENNVSLKEENIISDKITIIDKRIEEKDKDLNLIEETEINIKSNNSALDKPNIENKLNNPELDKPNIENRLNKSELDKPNTENKLNNPELDKPNTENKLNNAALDKPNTENKLSNSELNKTDIDSIDIKPDKFVTNETKHPVIEKDIKSDNKDSSSLTKITEQNLKKHDLEQIKQTDKKNVQPEENLTVKHPEESEILTDKIKPELIDVSDKISNNTEKTTDKKLNNILPGKNINKKPTELINNVKNVDNEKNITNKDIEITAIADKPVKTEEMKVIVFEPIFSPIAELDKSLNTNKTSDIVKFLDANLSSEKTSKTNKTSSARQSAQKSSEKAIKMTESDAKFFNNLIETNQQVIEGTKTADKSANIKELEESQSVQVSKTLLNALKESQENNKSFRVDFDKDLSVILRVNKDGKISAEFLPGDKAVEQYLKANLPLLQQQFKDEGLEYENLSYRQHKKDDEDKQKQNNKDNKKENGYE